MMGPSARSTALLAADGWLVDTVERQCGPIKRDLFGAFDLLAIRDTATLAVQVTTASHAADRRAKVLRSPLLGRIRAAGWVLELHSWRKTHSRWQCRREVL
jgi:hypothetical protein